MAAKETNVQNHILITLELLFVYKSLLIQEKIVGLTTMHTILLYRGTTTMVLSHIYWGH